MLPRIKSEVSPANFEQWRELIRKYDEIHPLKFNDSDEILKPLRSVVRFINTAVNFKIERGQIIMQAVNILKTLWKAIKIVILAALILPFAALILFILSTLINVRKTKV